MSLLVVLSGRASGMKDIYKESTGEDYKGSLVANVFVVIIVLACGGVIRELIIRASNQSPGSEQSPVGQSKPSKNPEPSLANKPAQDSRQSDREAQAQMPTDPIPSAAAKTPAASASHPLGSNSSLPPATPPAVHPTAAVEVSRSNGTRISPLKLNAGLVAHVDFIGRDRDAEIMTVALRLENTSPQVAFVILAGEAPQAVDSAGGVYKFSSVAGVARCPSFGAHYSQRCLHGWDGTDGVPLSSFTQIDPGQAVIVTFRLRGNASQGPLASFSATLAFRAAATAGADTALPDQQRRKNLRLVPLGLPPLRIIDAQSAGAHRRVLTS